jgi:hypothetical protein
MSDLAPFVAAVVRDKVVTELQGEVSQLHTEREELRQLASHYREMYERSQSAQRGRQQQQQSPFRTVSLVVLHPPPVAAAGGGGGRQEPVDPLSTVLASCRVNLEVALSGENGGILEVFGGHPDVTLPLRDLARIQLRVGSRPACFLSELQFRSTLYFECAATRQSYVKVAMEHGPDLLLEAGIGPVSGEEYARLFDLPPQGHLPQPASRGAGAPEDGGCFDADFGSGVRVLDAASRPLVFRRLADLAGESQEAIFKLVFDDARMSSDFLFEFLDAPYHLGDEQQEQHQQGVAGAGLGGGGRDNAMAVDEGEG